MPDATRDEVTALYERHVNVSVARLAAKQDLPLETASAGTRVTDDKGREYLDCGGFATFLLGHRHPRVVRALHEQLDRHPVASRGLLSRELAVAARGQAMVEPDGLGNVNLG